MGLAIGHGGCARRGPHDHHRRRAPPTCSGGVTSGGCSGEADAQAAPPGGREAKGSSGSQADQPQPKPTLVSTKSCPTTRHSPSAPSISPPILLFLTFSTHALGDGQYPTLTHHPMYLPTHRAMSDAQGLHTASPRVLPGMPRGHRSSSSVTSTAKDLGHWVKNWKFEQSEVSNLKAITLS